MIEIFSAVQLISVIILVGISLFLVYMYIWEWMALRKINMSGQSKANKKNYDKGINFWGIVLALGVLALFWLDGWFA